MMKSLFDALNKLIPKRREAPSASEDTGCPDLPGGVSDE